MTTSSGPTPSTRPRRSTGALTSQDGQLVAQYWFFWVYNQWNDVHEGDWEMAQLVFDTDSVEAALERGPVTYAFAQHEGSEYATVGENDDKLVLDGVRPVVFAAEGSHASFFSSSRWFGKSGATGFGCDNTSALVERVDPELIMLPGDDVPTEGSFAWLSYEGHWGEKAPSFNNGPTGPVSKTQWSAPVSWVDDEGRDTAVALPFAGSERDRRRSAPSAPRARCCSSSCSTTRCSSSRPARRRRSPRSCSIVRGSSRGVLGRAARAWRADARRQLRIGVLVLAGVAVSGAVQWALLRWTPLGTLVEVLGDSSAWVLPLVAVIGLAVSLPVVSWVGAAAIHASTRDDSDRPIVDVATRRRPMIWSGLIMLIVAELAVFLFPPLAVLVSRWMVAPVLADGEGVTTRGTLGASHRLVRGHGWRAIGMVVTIVLVASIAGVVGALVLLLTSLTFAVAGVHRALAAVVLVPYLALVLVEFTADLVAG